MPYTPTWNNPYLPVNGPSGALGQSAIPSQQMQMASGWQQYQQPVNGIVKVNGSTSALQYALPPNSTSPALFDNDGKVFYVVSTDGTGTKSIETFDFKPHVEQTLTVNGAQFVSREEFDDFVAKVTAVMGEINGSNAAVPTANATNGHEGKNGVASANDAGRPFGAGK